MMMSVKSIRLQVILADVLGSILKGVVCHFLLLVRFLFLTMLYTNMCHYFLSFTN